MSQRICRRTGRPCHPQFEPSIRLRVLEQEIRERRDLCCIDIYEPEFLDYLVCNSISIGDCKGWQIEDYFSEYLVKMADKEACLQKASRISSERNLDA